MTGDEIMDLIEQPGEPLDLVHHNPRAGRTRFNPFAQQPCRSEQGQVVVIEEEVEPQGIIQVTPEPRRLACRARPEEEE
jgi:hypothetical protein